MYLNNLQHHYFLLHPIPSHSDWIWNLSILQPTLSASEFRFTLSNYQNFTMDVTVYGITVSPQHVTKLMACCFKWSLRLRREPCCQFPQQLVLMKTKGSLGKGQGYAPIHGLINPHLSYPISCNGKGPWRWQSCYSQAPKTKRQLFSHSHIHTHIPWGFPGLVSWHRREAISD